MPAQPAAPSTPINRQRIAIIGSGIAGLSAAWLLSRDHDVTLYERAAKPGMGIYSVDIPWADKSTSIDIPLRVFTPAYYPSLLRLYRDAGVRTETTDHAAAYADADNRLFFHYGNLQLGKRSLSFPKLLNGPLLAQHLNLFNTLQQHKHSPDTDQQSFGSFLQQHSLDNDYCRQILLPALATVCTCDYDDVLAYPADILINYLTCGVMKDGLMRASGGVDEVVAQLLESNVSLRTATAIDHIEEDNHGVRVCSGAQTAVFDRVVIATQPHHASQILSKLPSAQSRCQQLQQIPVVESRMQLHTDTSLLPASLMPLAPVSYFLPGGENRPEATVDLAKAIGHLRNGPAILQVWNPLRAANPESVLADVTFSRPLVTLQSRQAVRELRRQDASQRILLTGSYLCDGIPLLDGAVESSLRVAHLIGSSRAW